MPDGDFNLVKPVDALGNITGLAPVKRREQRNQKREKDRNKEKREPTIDEEIIQQDADDTAAESQNTNKQKKGGIDYCA